MDQIADMLTMIRNGLMAKHSSVNVPYSKIKFEIARVLMEEGYINNFEVKEKTLTIQLKYTEEGKPVIYGIERVSKPSKRYYVGVKEIPKVKGGLGIAILSTPKGILTDREAREKKLGGEVLCLVY